MRNDCAIRSPGPVASAGAARIPAIDRDADRFRTDVIVLVPVENEVGKEDEEEEPEQQEEHKACARIAPSGHQVQLRPQVLHESGRLLDVAGN